MTSTTGITVDEHGRRRRARAVQSGDLAELAMIVTPPSSPPMEGHTSLVLHRGTELSIQSLTDLAVKRDRTQPGASVPAADDLSVPPDRGDQADQPSSSTVSYSDVLVRAIPTESLSAYVALIAVFSTIAPEEGSYLPARWWAFWGFMGLTLVSILVAYSRKASSPVVPAPTPVQDDGTPTAPTVSGSYARPAPVAELVAGMTAAGAWGLALPGGPLSAWLSGDVETLTVTSIVVGGGALVALAAGPLGQGAADPGSTS